jgi:AcrR family transcriptional regulator
MTPTAGGAGGVRPLRADALRNHAQLLTAARDVFVESGPDAPLEEIAARAGVGIATLYRRFANRQELMRAVVLDALTRTREAAEQARADAPSAHEALVRYMHSVLDIRISAVIPVLLDRIDLEDHELSPARDQGAAVLTEIIEAAQAEGSLRADLTFADIGMLLVRLARPLPGPLTRELNDSLAHRHLDLLIDGLRPVASAAPASGPALSRDDLHELRKQAEADAGSS